MLGQGHPLSALTFNGGPHAHICVAVRNGVKISISSAGCLVPFGCWSTKQQKPDPMSQCNATRQKLIYKTKLKIKKKIVKKMFLKKTF